MNPSIAISVDLNNKAANALSGMVTVGAKVDVTVTGITADDVPAWASTDDFTGKSLRFRVVDATGRDLVRFPLVRKTATSNGDAWTVSGDEFTATGVEFDTAQLREAMQGMPYDAKMEFGIILDSIVDDAQYAVGKLKVKQWAACPTDDPTVLPDWRETLVRLDADLVAVEAKKTAAETEANTATEKADAAGNSATAASVSAGAAATSAALANEYANGKTVNGVVTKGAKQYAADAAESATNLAQAVTAAQAARDKADEYANGKTVGGTVTQKGAQQYAEDAASSATDASTVLASAVKTTEQTLSDGEKTQARTNIGAQETLPLMDDGQTYGINVRGANEALTSSKAMIALKDEDGHFIKTTYANKSNLTSHTGNGGIHVTADQKAAWSAKQDAIAAFLKDASVSNKTLTLTKKDGTTVQFQGGSSAWADITGKPQSFTPSAHQHTKSQITDFPQSMDPNAHASAHATGGSDAITPASIGAIGNTGEQTIDPLIDGTDGKLIINGGDGGGSLEVNSSHPYDVPASIKKDGKEVATEEQLPYASTSTPADRTCSTVTVASTGASVTIPKPSTDSKVTSFCVYLDMTALTGTAPTIGFKYSDNTDADILTRGGEGLSYETGAVNAVFFIQCGTKYIASAQVYK